MATASIESATRGEPLYVQVAATLRDEIARGIHASGAQLPPEDRLSARFSVSRFTVREALRRLREEGLVASRRGAGTMVVPPPGDPRMLGVVAIGDLVAFAADAPLVLETVAMETLDAAAAAHAGVDEGSAWLACRGVRRAGGGGAACVAEYLVHRRFAAIASALPGNGRPVFALVEDMFAVRIAEVEQRIGAIAIDDATAARLGVEPGGIALEVRRTYRLGDGTIAQIAHNTHPAAHFRHSMTMRRSRT